VLPPVNRLPDHFSGHRERKLGQFRPQFTPRLISFTADSRGGPGPYKLGFGTCLRQYFTYPALGFVFRARQDGGCLLTRFREHFLMLPEQAAGFFPVPLRRRQVFRNQPPPLVQNSE
jgi:hypothetical protein